VANHLIECKRYVAAHFSQLIVRANRPNPLCCESGRPPDPAPASTGCSWNWRHCAYPDPVVSQWTHTAGCVGWRAIGYVGSAVRRSTGHVTIGPMLYFIYTAPLFDIIAQRRVNAHQYADDLQLYLCVPLAEASIATDCLDGFVDVEAWLIARLNPRKTHAMTLSWIGYAQQLAKKRLMTSQFCHLKSALSLLRGTLASLLIVSQLSMPAHVEAVCHCGYYQLRQLRPLKRCMTDEPMRS